MKMFDISQVRPITSLEGNCTVLNTVGNFYCVREPERDFWKQALLAVHRNDQGLRNSRDLVAAQLDLYNDGFVGIQPVWSVKNNGYWYLRNTSNLGDTFPAGREKYSSVSAALEAACRWHSKDPENREVTMRAGVYKTLQAETQQQTLTDHTARAQQWRNEGLESKGNSRKPGPGLTP